MTVDRDVPVIAGGDIRRMHSRCSFRVEVLRGDQELSQATAFFVVHDREWFLVTNGHVVTGLHAFTGRQLWNGPQSDYPSRLRMVLHEHVEAGDPDLYRLSALTYDLYSGAQPNWYVHPSLGHRCDVVAMKVDWPKSQKRPWYRAANRIDDARVPVAPGTTVFLLGHPSGISVKLGMPIWKSGYVASEPVFPITVEQDRQGESLQGPFEGLPAFFIDSQTRPGMSGSPVIAQYTGTWDITDPYRSSVFGDDSSADPANIVLGGTRTEFVGCYSGRIQSRELDAGLGICWQKDVIEEICTTRQRAQHPHLSSVPSGS